MTSIGSEASRGPLDLDRLAEDFLARYRRGERPSLTQYTIAYPELAEDIRDLFPALVEIEQMKSLAGGPLEGGRSVGPPLTRLGDYLILGIIGQGAMGIVYEAIRESLRSRVALKIMHPRYRDHERYLRRFHVEARAAARLHHTNIVSVFDYGEADGFVYYAMPLIVGHSLEKVLEDVRRLRNNEEGPRLDAGRAAPSVVPTHRVEPSVVDRLPTGSEEIAQSLLFGRFGIVKSLTERAPRWTDSETRTDLANANETPAALLPFTPPPPIDDSNASALSPPSTLVEQSDDRYHREVARLGAQAADALAYAHRRGVLHRDIKPSNLLLDALGNVWVTDFGLAKLEDGDDLSRSTDVVGTLRYMSPERFRRVSSHSGDIYALGATLYELLTLQPVFEELDHVGLVEQITRTPPVPPRQHDRRIPRDLQTIILKALAKDPKDRFADADEMAADLRRFLENRPICSRAVPSYERLWRWSKRNPSLAAVNVLVAVLTVAIAVIASFSAVSLRTQRDEISRNLVLAHENEIRAHQNAARGQRLSRRVGQRFEALNEIQRAVDLESSIDGFEESRRVELRNDAIAAMALPDLRVNREVNVSWAKLRGSGATFDADMTRYAVTIEDGTVVVGSVKDGRELARFPGIDSDDQGRTSNFSPNGRYLAMSANERKTLQVWDLTTGRVVLKDLKISRSNVRAWEFRPGERELAVGGPDGSVLLIELPSGRELRRFPPAAKAAGTIAFSPDGSRIAVGDGTARKVQILETDTGRVVTELPHPETVFHLAWNPRDPDVLAAGCEDNNIYIWSISAKQRVTVLRGDTYSGLVVAFHPSGSMLASRGWHATLRLWDTKTGRQIIARQSYWGPELFFSRDGHRLAGEFDRGVARVLEFAPGDCRSFVTQPFDATTSYAAVAIDREGRRLAGSSPSGVCLWDVPSGTYLGKVPSGDLPVKSLEFEPSGSLIVSNPWTLRWRIRPDPKGGGRIGPPEFLSPYRSIDRFSMSHDGSVIAVPNYEDGAVVFDAAEPAGLRYLFPHEDVRIAGISPDGRTVVTSTHRVLDGLRLWDAQTGRLIHDFPELPRHVCHGAVFSPDGRWILALGDEGIVLIDAVTGKPRKLKRELGPMYGDGMTFSPDSKTIALVTAVGAVSLIDVNDGEEVARFEDPEQAKAFYFTFSRDGSYLAVSVQGSAAIRVWDIRGIRRRLRELKLDWKSESSQESPASEPKDIPNRLEPAFRVDRGNLDHWMQDPRSIQIALPNGYREALAKRPTSAEGRHLRAHLLASLGRHDEAEVDFSAAISANPEDIHLYEARGKTRLALGDSEAGASDIEEALRRGGQSGETAVRIALALNNSAWSLARAPKSDEDARKAVSLARRAVALSMNNSLYLNTLGVALYRVGKDSEAIPILERSLAENGGESDAFDLFFLAMTNHRRGMSAEARGYYDRALLWRREHKQLQNQWNAELDIFEAEARALLDQPLHDLPENVFAPGSD